MADARRTRDYDPELTFLNDPSYAPLDQIGTSGGGLSAEGLSLPGATAPLDNRVQPMDFSDLGLQTGSSLLPQYANRDDDAFKGPGEQLMSGLGQIGSALGNDIRDGFNAITPDQSTIDNIAMRLQRAHAIGQGTLPYYLQEQMARQQMEQAQDVMGMKRQQLAQQLQQHQQGAKDKEWDDMFGIITNPNLSDPQRMKLLKTRGQSSQIAFEAAQSINEKMLGKFNRLVKSGALPRSAEEYAEGLKSGDVGWDHIAADIDIAEKSEKEETQALASENAQQKKVQKLIDLLHTNPQVLKATDLNLLKKYHDEQEQRSLLIEELKGKLTKQSFDNQKAPIELANAQADLAFKQNAPREAYSAPMGANQTVTGLYDPKTQQTERMIGKKAPLVEVNTGTKASEEAQKRFMDKAAENYDRLRNVPDALKNIEEAKLLIPSAKNFMGPAGETLLESAKFLNNRLGMQLDAKGVKSAEELRSRIFFNIMDNLKKLDAQPSQQQQQVMQDSLGKLGTDPKAMSSILDAYGDSLRRKVDLHNKEIESSERRGVQFPFDAKVKLDPKAGSKLQQEFVETRVTKDGRKLGKTKDGKIVEIK